MSEVADDAFGRFLENQMNSWREIGVEAERKRVIEILEAERDNWVKPGVFNYKVALTTLIERIKE